MTDFGSRTCLGYVAIVGVLTIATGEAARADRMACPPDENCQASAAEKIRRSMRDAAFVVRGSFQVTTHGWDKEPLSDGTSFIEVNFQIDEVLKGQPPTSSLDVKFAAYTVPAKVPGKEEKCEPCSGNSPKNADPLVLSQELTRLERALEAGQLPKAEYEAKLAETRLKILTSPTYLYKDFVLVPIRRGAMDATYRVATVPLEFGKQYVFMVFKHVGGGGVTTLFSYQLDLYPATELSAVRTAVSLSAKGRPQ